MPNAAPRKSVTRRDAAHLKTIAPKRIRRIGPAEGCSGKRKLIDRGLAFPASVISHLTPNGLIWSSTFAKVNFSAAWLAWPISSCYPQPINEGYGASNLLDISSDGAGVGMNS